jgi:hypothetical protein
MGLENAQAGTRVRVRLDYRNPPLQGAFGTIKKRYASPNYTAFEVLFPDGESQLFWEHQLEEAREPSSPPMWWWVFSRSKLSERT